jgi:hypothetical protein
MRAFNSRPGPLRDQTYYRAQEIEDLCSAQLRETGLYPAQPEPIRVERFIEKRFKVTPSYEDLPNGVLGWTRFGPSGMDAIVIARSLADSGGTVAERRVSSTLAHEAGHGLLHSDLFARGMDNRSLFSDDDDIDPDRILCRDDQRGSGERPHPYSGRWWEYQANLAMAALLLPRSLVATCLSPILSVGGTFGRQTLAADRREDAVRLLSDFFSVSRIMARIRLDGAYPAAESAQLTL